MHLGYKLKLYRKAKNLDQVQMSDLIGVSVRTYGEIEKNGIVTKAKDVTAIRKLLAGDQQIISDTDSIKVEAGDPNSVIASLTRSIEKMTSYTQELVRNNTELVRNNTDLVNKVISSGATASAPSPGGAARKDKWDDSYEVPLSGKIKSSTSRKRKDTLKSVNK